MEKELIKVVFLGYQEQVDGTSYMCVNEVEGHSTVKFDKQKHELVEEEEKGGAGMKCKICKKNEATVRDRNNPTSPRKTICKECHRQRLMCDMTMILDFWRKGRP